MAEIHTFETLEKLMRKAADLVLETALESVRLRGRFVWLLSGGTTPAGLYRLLVDESAEYAARMPWQQTFVFWGDERWVPPDDPQNNARMATEALLSRVPVPATNSHPISTVGVPPEDAAAAMERQMRSLYQQAEPRPDFVLLGLGEDGHTASLFSGTAAVTEDRLLYTATYVPKLYQWRVTAALPLLNAARTILFLVTGGEKAQAVRQVLAPEPETIVLPASLVRPASGRLLWFLDRAAGELLPY